MAKRILYETDRIRIARLRRQGAKAELDKGEQAHKAASLGKASISLKTESEGPTGPPTHRTP